ncbi:MAG: hypothetical protein JWP02_2372 [Acidimicrobiales bacterium]|nr:hypothetical protein [Acidimicrobiales bacterium]
MSPRTVAVIMLFAAVCLTAPFIGVGQAGGVPPTPVDYRAPVPGPVVDPFRPPPGPYAAGNRGVDYRTRPGASVVAAAAGTVVFAGPVAGRLVVVVLHGDGLRTSYTGLASLTAHRGQQVAAGQQLGTAADRLQFGVRAGAAYLDPGVLLHASGAVHAHLVRDDASGGTGP